MKYASLYAVSSALVCLGLPLAVAGAAQAVPAYLAALGVLALAFGLFGVVAVLTESTPIPVASVGWASDSVPVTVGWESDRPVKQPRKRTVKATLPSKPTVKRVAARASKVTTVTTRPESSSPKRPRTRKAPPA